MTKPLNILFIASESVPFVKTGGLADVVGALPAVMASLGHNVMVVLPKYGDIDQHRYPMERYFHHLGVWMGDTEEWCAVDRLINTQAFPVYFIEFDRYFKRPGLYHDSDYNDFADNPRRFAFFSRAALQLCIDMGFNADIIHLHDWQTAPAAAYQKIWHWNNPIIGKAATLLTIHNVQYQGIYPAWHLDYCGFQMENYTPDKFEDNGRMNFLKGGITFADFVNTVSPNYAHEISLPGHPSGMAPYLTAKADRFSGILNGVDYQEWNPAIDPRIPATFSADDLSGKIICKQELQRSFYLEIDPDIPLIGVISRFADQKGLDLLAQAIEAIVTDMRVQFVILGSGNPDLEGFFGELPARYPGKIGSYIGFNNDLAHRIEAGSDFFLMPSRYEPCGLNQIYSLKYGTLPIVRATGGLLDTVEQYNEMTGHGTGFIFWEPSADSIYFTTGWAVSTYYDRKSHIERLIQNAMTQDFSWKKSAGNYLDAYISAMEYHKGLK
ncbi:glycogen synthase [bacterium]|nr:glycogen synthase [candidate division CSSED10-310 bacterium]